MSQPPCKTGEVAFDVPGADKPCKTVYRIYGSISSGERPLVCLHGGPGVEHSYLLPMTDLVSLYSIPIILYDQLGCGASTHLPEKNGNTEFWTVALFLAELDNLLKHLGISTNYDLFGHSWGGMLASEHAVLQPPGLKYLILASSPSDMELWVQANDVWRAELPQEVQDTLHRHEKDGTTDSKEYEEAVDVFYKLHLCRLDKWPEELNNGFRALKEDSTVYNTMNGPSEFHVTGSLKSWSVISRLHNISVPTLLLNGAYDEARDSVVEPFFRRIGARTKWVVFASSSHMAVWEERERHARVCGQFLRGGEN